MDLEEERVTKRALSRAPALRRELSGAGPFSPSAPSPSHAGGLLLLNGVACASPVPFFNFLAFG